MHAIMDHNFQSYIDSGCIPYFEEQKAKGRIKHLGFSTHASIPNFKTFLGLRDWDFVLQQLNAYDWVYDNIREKYEILTEKGIPVIAMGPVRGGRMAALTADAEKILKDARPEWTLSEWAFRWVKNRKNNIVALSGMTTLEQMQENVRLFSDAEGMSAEEEKLLHKALEVFKGDVQVACTVCKYCVDNDNCPAKINIPGILEVYNTYKVGWPWDLEKLDKVESEGKVADCVGCSACENVCPQKIGVQGIIKELAELTKKKDS
jgi:hypothetical protein